MRLIDADELIKNREENDSVRIAVENAPTAYEKDKVARALKALLSPFLTGEKKCVVEGVEDIVNDGMCKS